MKKAQSGAKAPRKTGVGNTMLIPGAGLPGAGGPKRMETGKAQSGAKVKAKSKKIKLSDIPGEGGPKKLETAKAKSGGKMGKCRGGC